MFDTANLGQRIKYYRKLLGLTQNELGEKLNISFQAVSAWETAQSLPDIENLAKLARLFGISMERLLTHDDSDKLINVIAIDGGGTKTEAVLCSSDGRVLKRLIYPGSNSATIGIGAAVEIHSKIIDACYEAVPDIKCIFIGCAGDQTAQIRAELVKKYPKVELFVESDAVNALFSAEGELALICGTGSVIVKKVGNDFKLTGGWGYKMGDSGSAYNFGKAALRAALAYEDGLKSSKLIYNMILQAVRCDKLRGEYCVGSVSEIAALAPVLFAAVKEGDGDALKIVENEMQELAQLINAASSVGDRIIACGGIMMHYHQILLPVLKKYIGDYVSFVIPKLPPIFGAAKEGFSRINVKLGDEFEKQFETDYERLKHK